MLFYVLFIPHMLFALSAHEASHAYAAYRCGDDTAALLGRVTLNPLRHIDPLGLLAFFIIHFGWAKPVPVNPLRFKHAGRDNILVSLAGPGSNLAVGLVLLLAMLALHAFVGTAVEWSGPALAFLLVGAQLNVGLCFFNLIPVPPLDGSHILMEILPREITRKLEPLMGYGSYLLLGLVLISSFGFPLFELLVWTPVRLIISLALGDQVLADAFLSLNSFLKP